MRYRFLEFTLDTDARVLNRRGAAVKLSPKAFDLLSLLVRQRDRVVGRKELYDHLWPESFVVEANLPVLIREIRKATEQDVIATVHGTGYRFAAPVRADSVAVMPLANRSGDPSLDYLASGIADQIINRLALIPSMRVLSRSSTFGYRGIVEPQAIGSDLSVAAVVLGTLTRTKAQTAVTIELVDTQSGRLILSRTYVRGDDELVMLPLRIAADVAEHLGADAGPDVVAVPTRNAEAYRFYLHGRECLNRFDPPSLHESISWNERAVAADPNFAAAYSDLARAYLHLGIYFESALQNMPLALQNVRRALDIDSTLVDAHINLGCIHFMYEWDWKAAERELFASSELHPRAAEAFACTSHVLETAGCDVDAERFIRRGLESEPRSIPLLLELGCNSYAHRQYDTAIDQFREVLALDPRNLVAYWGLGRSYAQKAMYDQALNELGRVEELYGFAPPVVAGEIGYVLGRSGRSEQADGVIATMLQLRDQVYIDPYLVAVVHLGMGRSEEALTWLERAFEEKSAFAIAIPADAKWDPLRSDPRFSGLIGRLGLAS